VDLKEPSRFVAADVVGEFDERLGVSGAAGSPDNTGSI
jgi:hypothetical protein